MKFHRSILTGAALALAVAPVVAHAEQASGAAGKLSLSRAVSADQAKRTGAPVARTNQLKGRSTGFYILGAIVVGLIVWGVIELTDSSDSP